MLLIRGVSSCSPSGPVELLLANDSLGNSIIPTKPGLSGRAMPTYNFDFAELYEFTVRQFSASEGQAVVVRMNAKGVEGPIIDFLSHRASMKPAVIAGSIGDIRKCFGHEAYHAAQRQMRDASIPFVTLTSDPRTWAPGLSAIMEILK